ncbi:MAG: histidine kinase [Candidatus Dormiibacterota bacterium]
MTNSNGRLVASAASWAAVVFVVAGSAATLWLIYVLSPMLQGEALRGYAVVAFGLTNVIFGGLLLRRVPGNIVGWLLTAAAVDLTLTELATFYGAFALQVNQSFPAGALAAWLSTWTAFPAVGLMVTLLVLLFPDGRVPSPRWRILAIASAAYILVISVFGAISSFPSHGGAVRIDEVGGIVKADTIGGDLTDLIGYAFLGLLILCAFSVVGLFRRRRRASATVRQQLKWFLFACAFILVFGFVPHFSSVVISFPADVTFVISAFFIASFLLVPVAAGFAILKYRLYDIDVVISRTLVYGALAAFITAVYVGIVVGIGTLVGSGGQPNLVLSIVATAIVAVAFQPVRERLQRVANRLVYGKRATPYEVLSQFSERVAETYAADDALPRMARVLAEGTGAERARVWLRAGTLLRPAAAWPESHDADEEPVPLRGEDLPDLLGEEAVPVRHQGELLGALTVTKRQGESLTPIEQKLLDDLAHQAGLVLKNVGLTAELLARLEDLRASRQRLVAAQDEERRRLERNLHDGAQQNLVALKVKLGLAEALSGKDPARAKELIGQLKGDTDEALETLRDLARGIYPALLADKGLTAALEAQARKATLPVDIDADGVGRYQQDVEAAVYFCVLEALQNTQKYAQARKATVRLTAEGGDLRFEVADDGKGFDPETAKRGAGLTNMADRLDALGGGIRLDSAVGGGARLSGHLPVEEMAPA